MSETEYTGELVTVRYSAAKLAAIVIAVGLWIASLIYGIVDDTIDAEVFWSLLVGGLTFGLISRDI